MTNIKSLDTNPQTQTQGPHTRTANTEQNHDEPGVETCDTETAYGQLDHAVGNLQTPLHNGT